MGKKEASIWNLDSESCNLGGIWATWPKKSGHARTRAWSWFDLFRPSHHECLGVVGEEVGKQGR